MILADHNQFIASSVNLVGHKFGRKFGREKPFRATVRGAQPLDIERTRNPEGLVCSRPESQVSMGRAWMPGLYP